MPAKNDIPRVGWEARIKTDNLCDFGQKPLESGPLQGRLKIQDVRELREPASDGSRYEVAFEVPGRGTVVAREKQITITQL